MAFKKPGSTAPAEVLVDFGDPHSELYMQDFTLPEGDYLWADLNVVMHAGFGEARPGQQQRNARLGVMLDVNPLDANGEPKEETKQVFYSMGTSASESFMPNSTGKGIVAIPGASGRLPGSTNWIMLITSLRNAMMPAGAFTNDVSVLQGIKVHMQPVPEPEQRKNFASKTAEVEDAGGNRTRNVAVVTEVHEAPWMEEGAATPAKSVTGKPGPVKVPAKAATPAATESVELDDDMKQIAIGALATVLEKNQKGIAKAGLKVSAGKEVVKLGGDDALQVIAAAWSDDSVLSTLVGEIGFTISGPMVKPS